MRFAIILCCLIIATGLVAAAQLAMYTITKAELNKAELSFVGKCQSKTSQTAKDLCKNCFLYQYTELRLANNQNHTTAMANLKCPAILYDELTTAGRDACVTVNNYAQKQKCKKCATVKYFDVIKKQNNHQKAIDAMKKSTAACAAVSQTATYTITDTENSDAWISFFRKCQSIQADKEALCEKCFLYHYMELRLVHQQNDTTAMTNVKSPVLAFCKLTTARMGACKTASLAPTKICIKCATAQYFEAIENQEKHAQAINAMKRQSSACAYPLANYPISEQEYTTASTTFSARCGNANDKGRCKFCLMYDYHRLRLNTKTSHKPAMATATCANFRQMNSKSLEGQLGVHCNGIWKQAGSSTHLKVLACVKCILAQYFAALKNKTHPEAIMDTEKLAPNCRFAAIAGLYP